MACDPCIKRPYVCPDALGCPPNVCPDFQIKRHDTKPALSVKVEDCDGPLDLTDVVVEVSMWANAKIRTAITEEDTYFALADNIGFEQSLVGDIIVIERVRAPEQMLITGHDETNKLIRVQRGYNGSTVSSYPKGTKIKIFRVLNAFGETAEQREDVLQLDETVVNELIESRVVYNWQPNDTCLPGCYYVEFKLLKMDITSLGFSLAADITPSFTVVTPSSAGCSLGTGVEWARRVPVDQEGFLIRIIDTQTSNLLS